MFGTKLLSLTILSSNNCGTQTCFVLTSQVKLRLVEDRAKRTRLVGASNSVGGKEKYMKLTIFLKRPNSNFTGTREKRDRERERERGGEGGLHKLTCIA